MTRPEDMPQPDWYSDGLQIQSQTFNHNGPQAVPLYTEETLARAILAAEKRVREKCAQKADGYADLWRSASVAIAASIRKGGEDASQHPMNPTASAGTGVHGARWHIVPTDQGKGGEDA